MKEIHLLSKWINDNDFDDGDDDCDDNHVGVSMLYLTLYNVKEKFIE